MISGHREFARLMRQPRLRDLLASYPPVVYRPYRRYLATSFTKKDRRATLKHHYTYLLTRINDAFFSQISTNKILLWQKTVDDDVFTIKLSFTGVLQHGGDLLLEFAERSQRLFHMSFTIARGHVAGSAAAEVLLIGHVLGIAGHFDDIRRPTKACLDVAPPYLLMAAVQGLADALSVNVIAGVRNTEQITANSSDSENVFFDYDAFWRTHLGNEAEKFFLISVPIPEKPMALISASHRRRTRLKRQFRSEVAEAAKANFRSFLSSHQDSSI